MEMENDKKHRNFAPKDILAEDFILFSYSHSCKYYTNDLVGCSGNMKYIMVYSQDKAMRTYKMLFRKELWKDARICMVIPADYDSSGHMSYLLTSRSEGSFYENNIYFYYKEAEECYTGEGISNNFIKNIGKTTSVPLLFALEDAKPALLMQNEQDTFIYKYDGHDWKKISVNNSEMGRLHRLHTSCFIDVTGDRLPEFVLEMGYKDKRCLKIFSSKVEHLKHIETVTLPHEIGPIGFADFNKSGYADLAYVSKEEDNFYLNILFNRRIKANEGEYESTPNKYKLCSISDNYEPIFLSNNIEMPSGMFIVDLFCDSVQHIVVTMKKKVVEKETFQFLLMMNNGRGEFSAKEPSIFYEVPGSGTISISFLDIFKVGRENLILNFVREDGLCILRQYKNKLVDDQTYHFSAITCYGIFGDEHNSFGYPLPGVSYKYRVLEDGLTNVGYQMPQSTFPHLQHQYVFFGVGSSPYLLDLKEVGHPCLGSKPYIFEDKIIPNSSVIIYKNSRDPPRVILNMNASPHIKNIWVVILLVSSLQLLILFGFFIRYKKREKKKRKAESLLFNFNAL